MAVPDDHRRKPTVHRLPNAAPNAPVPPHSIDAEESVLGAMLISDVAVAAAADVLQASDFYRPSHATIFLAALRLHNTGQPVDLLTLGEHLETRGQLDAVEGGRARIAELAQIVPAAGNVRHHARIVRDLATARHLIRAGTRIAQLGWDRPGDAADLVQQAHDIAQDLHAAAATPADLDHSWKPTDLLAHETGEPEQPTIGGLVYPGRPHLISGEPESLKSWLALVLAAEEIQAGRTVAYIDFETNPRDSLARLRDLQLTDDQIRDHFIYLAPSEPLAAGIADDVRQLLAVREPTLVIVDAFAGLAHLETVDENSRADIERLYHTVMRTLASSGAAILVIDHVAKDKENRGKFSIGSERKLGVVDIHLRTTTIQPFGRGRTGKTKIRTEKDRPGYLARPTAGQLHLTSDEKTGKITWAIHPHVNDDEEDAQPFRPTHLMERCSRYLEPLTEPVSRATVEREVEGQARALRIALTTLVREGHATEEPGPRGAKLLTSVLPYREPRDPTTPS